MVVSGGEDVRSLSERIRHLFRRAGFGATRAALEAAVAKGYGAMLEEFLHPEQCVMPQSAAICVAWGDFSGRGVTTSTTATRR
jgi:hypothetical protein